jgi:hypothetical protein
MKITNLAIIFFLIELCLFTVLDIRTENLSAITTRKMEYNKALDSAIDDGISDLVEVDSKRNLVLNKDAAVNQFYESLFSNFGVIGNSQSENKLKTYVPIILVTDTDGFYIYYSDTYQSGSETLINKKWSEKIHYSYQEGNLVFNFTLDTYLTIYDTDANAVYEGEYEDLKGQFSGSQIMTDAETFDTIRRSAIIDKIEGEMNYYINKHNSIAYQLGITYQFWLPRIEESDWYRTIDDVSMLVVFQGYPYKAGSTDTCNRYALGGARITKSDVYYITEENGMKYYHKSGCSHLINSADIAYYTKEECALEGAYPCPDCKP